MTTRRPIQIDAAQSAPYESEQSVASSQSNPAEKTITITLVGSPDNIRQMVDTLRDDPAFKSSIVGADYNGPWSVTTTDAA